MRAETLLLEAGSPEENSALQALRARLEQQFPPRTVEQQLLLEIAVHALWQTQRGLQFEARELRQDLVFHGPVMDRILRYGTAADKRFFRSLAELKRLQEEDADGDPDERQGNDREVQSEPSNVAAIRGRSNGTRAGSHWPEILVAVEDRNVQPADLVRLILMEMSLVCHELQTLSGHSSLEFKLKPLLAEVHALRTLAETTRHMTELAVQTDAVDPDGPKVRYLLDTLVGMFQQSILDAGCTEHTCISIYKFFCDSLALRESEIRRKMKEVVDFHKETPVWPQKTSNESAENSPANAAAERPTT